MATNLINSLFITLIGMSLVFGAIVLLWGLMNLLMKIAPDKEEPVPDGLETDTMDLKRQAAAIAVAIAMAQSERIATPKVFPIPPTAVVSAWQAVMRSRILNKRGQVR